MFRPSSSLQWVYAVDGYHVFVAKITDQMAQMAQMAQTLKSTSISIEFVNILIL